MTSEAVTRMTLPAGSPVKFRGKFDVFCCRFGDTSYFVQELLDQTEAMGEKVKITFEVFEIDKDFDEWCESMDVEIR